MARKAKRSLLRRLAGRLALAVVALVITSILLVLPLRWFDPATSAVMLADDSGRIPVLFVWQDLAQMSDAAILAVVAAEDQRFADHIGIDFESISDSLAERDSNGRLRGASTISQQVTKNLFLWNGRSYLRKGIEAYLTLVVEMCLPKRRIIEIYLNIVELGPGVYGFGGGVPHFFGKSAAELTDPEAALLAAVLPNPARFDAARPSPYVRERQGWILTQMARLRREGWLVRLGS